MSDQVFGKETPGSSRTEYNMLAFVFKQLLSQVQTATLVKVIACSNTGTVAPVGTVTVQPLVNQISGNGQPTPHGQLYQVPYFRLQAGNGAVILDPKPGDIGACVFCSRDISIVKATKKQANPASPQTMFDWADGLYMGGFLNLTPADYIQFANTGQINITSALEILSTAPTVSIVASTGFNVTGPTDINGATIDTSGDITSPGIVSATTVDATTVAATGDVTSDAGANSLNAIALDVASISGQVTNISNAPVALEATSASFPNGYVLTAGTNITLTPATSPSRTLTIAASGGGWPFTGAPATIPDLTFWWESDNILAASGKRIVALQNRNPWGNGGPSSDSAGSGADGALVSTSPLNSLPVLTFGGGQSRFTQRAQLASMTKATLFVVMKPANFSNYNILWSGAAGCFEYGTEQTTGKQIILVSNTVVIAVGASGLTAGTWYQCNVTLDNSTQAYAFRRGRAADGSGTGTAGTINAANFGIGYQANAAVDDFPGDVAAIIAFNRVLSGSEITTVENYIFGKWGV